jgi:hypothetical protein
VADVRLGLVHRQLQPLHHVPHCRQGVFRPVATHDHEVVGIIDEASLEAVLMTKRLPAQNEPPHVEIRQQGRERGSLRSSPVLVLVAGRAVHTALPVGLFHRGDEPLLHQVKQRLVADPASHALHQLRMRNAIEVTAQIGIDHLAIALLQQL